MLRRFNIGATVDPIIEQAPCDVVILKDCGGNKTFKNILVPVAGGPNGALAIEVASILSDSRDGIDGKITAFTVDVPNSSRRGVDLDAFLDEQAERLGSRKKLRADVPDRW